MFRLPFFLFVLLLGTFPLATRADVAVFAGGCFWCMEADFEAVPGVTAVESGFAGGSAETASYKAVGKGGTGHYEVVRITFDPARVSYEQLLYTFWRSVDPTDAGGQFCDRGASYRTAVFAQTRAQQAAAVASRKVAQAELGKKIVTPILGADPFYPAEAYHQDYYKSSKKVLTRFGLVSRKRAYKKYRKACGRDARLDALWGAAARSHAGG